MMASPVASYLTLGNPRTRLGLILGTFFFLAFLIISPRNDDAYSRPYGYQSRSQRLQKWSANVINGLTGSNAGRHEPQEVQHPIPKLMHEAQASFRALIMRQSKTLPAAVREYKARYKRDPPKGFDEWFAFAQANKVKIIDEYDLLMKDLEPFWSLSGTELRRRALQVRCTVEQLYFLPD